MNAIKFLMEQHREVEQLFEKLEQGEGDKQQLFDDLADALAVHTAIEEKLFYPATKSARTEDLLLEAVEEHLGAKRLLADMLDADVDDQAFDAKVKVLKEQVEHHVKEEEVELFPKVSELFSEAKLEELGLRLAEMAADVKEGVAEPREMVPEETDAPAPI
ncbi:MAG TPA: hemerythrin domain-containing protein [Myxococcales bacterium]|jgi:hemerythrin superfamily protein